MPIYEYQCAACGRRHEALQKFKEPPLRDCPHCGKPELVKLVSAAGFRLSGGGWYETDFKTGDKRNLASAPDEKKSGGKDKAGDGKQAGGKKASDGAAAGGAKSSSSASSTSRSSPGKLSSGKSSSGKPSSGKPASGGEA